MAILITMKAYLTASGRYPDRETHPEVTDELKANAIILLEKVNAFLNDLGVERVDVSSGFRPSEVNRSLANAAKKSLHMTGKAIDMSDSSGELDKLLAANPDKLREYGLFLEDPDSTPKWSHVDYGTRTDRPSRIFKI